MTPRHAARAVVDWAAALTGVLAARERAMRRGLTILMYHRVLPDQRCAGHHLPSLAMPLSAFREQVRFLSSRCRVVTVREGLEQLHRAPADAPPAVSLSFDDGYADNFSVAAPALEAAGIRASFFVTTGLIGTDQRLWFDQAALALAEHGREAISRSAQEATGRAPAASFTTIGEWMDFLKSLPPAERRQVLHMLPGTARAAADGLDRLMTPDELKSLSGRGHEVGSHSVTHPLLPQLADEDLERELTLSRSHIASWLGAPAHGLCYPNGDYDQRVAAAAQRAGYAYACGTRPGRNGPSQDRFGLLRIDMNPRRVTRSGAHDSLALRAEISLLHEVLR